MKSKVTELAFCSTRDAAQTLGVSVSTVIQWVDSGLLNAWKTEGGHRRVSKDSIDKILRRKPLDAHAPALRVLLIDDDPFMLELYKATISQWNYAPIVTTATNGYMGVFLLGSCKPDLVVLDLQMPEMDGFAMLGVLSESGQIKETKIVVVSGMSQRAIDDRGGLPIGIDFLPKPVAFDKLEAIAAALVASKY
jgi:excisionase family DNA binding protein